MYDEEVAECGAPQPTARFHPQHCFIINQTTLIIIQRGYVAKWEESEALIPLIPSLGKAGENVVHYTYSSREGP